MSSFPVHKITKFSWFVSVYRKIKPKHIYFIIIHCIQQGKRKSDCQQKWDRKRKASENEKKILTSFLEWCKINY